MKKKDQGNKWLIPTHSNSSDSHVVRRVNRFSAPQRPPVPEEEIPIRQALQNAPQSPQPQQPQQQIPPAGINNAQSHAVMRRRGPAPVINPAPALQKNAGGDAYQQAPPPGAASAVSHVTPRLNRMQPPPPPPPLPPEQRENAPTSAVSEVLRRSKEPERVTQEPIEGQAASRPVNRVRGAEIHPAPMPQPSSAVQRAPGAVPTDEQRLVLQKPTMDVMEEMLSVGETETDDSSNPFAGRWSHS